MPEYRVRTPDGSYRVTAPDFDTAYGAAMDFATGYKGQQKEGVQVAADAPASDTPRPPTLRTKAIEVGGDMIKSAGSGLVRGAAGVVGLPGFLRDATNAGVDWLGDKAVSGAESAGIIGKGTADTIRSRAQQASDKGDRYDYLPRQSNVTSAIEKVTGPMYKPESVPGEYAQTIAEFVPSALIMPGKFGMNLLNNAFLPGGASEAAGQATKGTALEPLARTLAAVGTSAATGFATGPKTFERMAGNAANNVKPEQFQAAQNLMREAQARGITLTVDEAVNAATNGVTKLGDLRRVIESTPEGGAVMNSAMAQRPGQVQAAGRRTLDQIGGRTATPSYQGQQLQEAAQSGLDTTRQNINKMADPYYEQLKGQRLPPNDFATLKQDPSFAGALAEIRGNPELAKPLAGLPDDNMAVVNEVVKRLDRNATSARQTAMNPQGDNRLASLRGNARRAADDAGAAASSDWRDARQIVAQGRERVLDPLEAGPMGQIAATADPQAQAAALMGRSPLPGSERETARAARMLAETNPDAARGVVRGGVEQTFNKTAGGMDTQARPDQFGGAKFAREIAGDPQRKANIDAAVRSVAGDASADELWQLKDILAATGWRQRQGSMTAFNQEALRDLERGGVQGAVQSGTNVFRAVREGLARARLGSQSEQLAELLLSGPEGVRRVQKLAAGGNDAARLALTLAAAEQSAKAPRE